MAKEAVRIATVISDMYPTFKCSIVQFVTDLCEVQEVDLIEGPSMAIALAHPLGLPYSPRKLFQLRDIARTRAAESWRRGSKSCVIVTKVASRANAPEFEECVRFVLRQKREVESWHLFPNIFGACLTLDAEIVPIDGGIA